MLKRVVTDFKVFDIEMTFFGLVEVKCYLLKQFHCTLVSASVEYLHAATWILSLPLAPSHCTAQAHSLKVLDVLLQNSHKQLCF